MKTLEDEIVLWYDNVSLNNCIYKDAVYLNQMILKKLDISKISYKIKQTNQELDKSKINIYVIEMHNVHIDYDIFGLISSRAKKLLQEGMCLLLYYPQEGHELDSWFLNIYKNLKQNMLLDCKIFFVFGNCKFEENYKKFIKNLEIESFCVPISISYFEGEYYDLLSETNSDLNSHRTKDFLCYNGKLRPHRLLLLSELKYRGLLENSLVSFTDTTYTGKSHTIESCLQILNKFNCKYPYVEDYVKNWSPLILDETPENFTEETVFKNNLSHYSSTFFSVVSETTMMNDFITEKTYKPIANYHPFVIIGKDKVLDFLKKQGYRTFPEIFDESYDNEKHPIKRFYQVIAQIEKFCKLTEREKRKKFLLVKDTLIHNKKIFLENGKDSTKKQFEKMFQIIEKDVIGKMYED